ncbi:hypothetical protein D3C81_443390 [compost metagenome]
MNSYKKRHKRWQDRIPVQTRYLSQLVDTKLIPYFEQNGFKQVGASAYGDTEYLIEAKDICFSKINGEEINKIRVAFNKYDKPCFQITIYSNSLIPPHKSISHGALVRKKNQYVYFWGKPWWLPRVFWLKMMSDETIKKILLIAPQILKFLDDGEVGFNIGDRKNVIE